VRIHPIPLTFIAVFGLVIAANALMITLAMRSAPGFVTDKAFERGKAYNRELAAERAQAALAWSTSLDVTDGRAAVRVADIEGRPVEGLTVRLSAARPVGPEPAILTRLAETSSGVYEGALELPREGQWQIEAVATRGADEFRFARRIAVR
jgi:nitrogen fixation protein FixH